MKVKHAGRGLKEFTLRSRQLAEHVRYSGNKGRTITMTESAPKSASARWKYFNLKEGNDLIAVCTLCNQELKRGISLRQASTTPLKNHLEKLHKVEYVELKKNLPL